MTGREAITGLHVPPLAGEAPLAERLGGAAVRRSTGLARIGRHRLPEELQPRPVPEGGVRWGVLDDPRMGLSFGGAR